jgi:diadenosine tetraphosphate (Ap4A) HIT family hydrolase
MNERGQKKLDSNCEFCIELSDFKKSRFAQIYNNIQRIVFSDKHFCIMPPLGQLFSGSLLLLPKAHYCSFAEIPSDLRVNLTQTINNIEKRLQKFGKIILFEHGTTPEIGDGCGIYHAHIHIIPIPSSISPEFLLGSKFKNFLNINDALSYVEPQKPYLLYRGTNKRYFIKILTKRLQSQYFRKKIHEYFNLESPWDWKKYKYEKKIIETINYLKNTDLNSVQEIALY